MMITFTGVLPRTLGLGSLARLGRLALFAVLVVGLVGCSQDEPGVAKIVSNLSIEARIAEVHSAAKQLRSEYGALKLRYREIKLDRTYARRVLEGADGDIAVRLNFIISMTNDLVKSPSSYNLIRVQWEIGETAKLLFDQRRRIDRLKE